jgi:hypothetical protein
MRLNSNTYPAYAKIESGNLATLQIDEMFTDMVKTRDDFANLLRSINSGFRMATNKYFITNTFMDAIDKATPKIMDGKKHINNIPTKNGVLFTDNGFTIYIATPETDNVKLVLFGFTRNTLTTYSVLYNNHNVGGVGATIKDGVPYNDVDYLAAYTNSILVALYFIYNCEIEQKIVEPNKKVINNGAKYFNESKSNVAILDCRWFTELINNNPFGVDGHLRWQPHGENRAKRKLIWIESFEKTGYHRKATKTE